MDGWRGQRGRGRGGGRGSGWGGGREYGGNSGREGGREYVEYGRGSGRERGRWGGRAGRIGGGTFGLGGDRTPGNQLEIKLGLTELQALETKTSDEIILHLTSSGCFPATEYLLEQQLVMEDHWIA